MPVEPETTAFPTLTDAQLTRLSAYGTEEAVDAGTTLFVEGQSSYDFIVMLEGEADISWHDRSTAADSVIATHGPGRFLGELSLLTGQRTFLRSRVRVAGRILRISPTAFRRLLASDAEIGDIVFAAFVARRDIILAGAGAASMRIIGSRYSKRAIELGSYVNRQHLAYQWIDLDGDDGHDVETLLASIGVGLADTPVVVSATGVLRNPTVGELAEHLGLVYQPTSLDLLDVVIVGAGPAGLAAAVYGASEGLRTLVVDRIGVGGQAGTSSRIENYVGFPSGISGGDLVNGRHCRHSASARRSRARAASRRSRPSATATGCCSATVP